MMQMCATLLEYCCSDLDASSSADCRQLEGLPLLMSNDGEIHSIATYGLSGRTLYLMGADEARLLAELDTSIILWKVSGHMLQ